MIHFEHTRLALRHRLLGLSVRAELRSARMAMVPGGDAFLAADAVHRINRAAKHFPKGSGEARILYEAKRTAIEALYRRGAFAGVTLELQTRPCPQCATPRHQRQAKKRGGSKTKCSACNGTRIAAAHRVLCFTLVARHPAAGKVRYAFHLPQHGHGFAATIRYPEDGALVGCTPAPMLAPQRAALTIERDLALLAAYLGRGSMLPGGGRPGLVAALERDVAALWNALHVWLDEPLMPGTLGVERRGGKRGARRSERPEDRP